MTSYPWNRLEHSQFSAPRTRAIRNAGPVVRTRQFADMAAAVHRMELNSNARSNTAVAPATGGQQSQIPG